MSLMIFQTEVHLFRMIKSSRSHLTLVKWVIKKQEKLCFLMINLLDFVQTF